MVHLKITMHLIVYVGPLLSMYACYKVLWNDVKLYIYTDLFNLDTLTVIAQFRCMVTDELFTNIHNLFTISAVIFSPLAQLVSHLCGTKLLNHEDSCDLYQQQVST